MLIFKTEDETDYILVRFVFLSVYIFNSLGWLSESCSSQGIDFGDDKPLTKNKDDADDKDGEDKADEWWQNGSSKAVNNFFP